MRDLLLALMMVGALAAGAQEKKPVAEMLSDPTPDALISVPSVKVALESSTKEQRATASGGMSFFNEALVAQLKISGPLNTSGDTRVADLSGLRSGGLAELSLAWFSWNPTRDDAAYTAVCQRYTGKDLCESEELTTQAQKDELKAAVYWRVPLELGVTGAIGYRSYSFLDPSTLEGSSVGVLSGSAGLRAAAYFRNIGKFSLQATWERTAEDGESTTICRPLGTTGTTRCDDTVLGAPSTADTALVALEYRRWLGSSLGIKPVLEYDVKAKVLGVRALLFAMQDKETGGLNGGVSVGWRSDTQRVDISIFVGEKFALPR